MTQQTPPGGALEIGYCTILARNYLPKALALAESLARHEPGRELVVLLIDVPDTAAAPRVPDLPNVTCVGTDVLGLDERQVHHLATTYELIEFATAVKPLLLERLLEQHERVAYLDPDTYATSPLVELPVDLSASPAGLLLTPHFLEPVGEDAFLPEQHLLTVGVYNLGFCAVDRRARPFLKWWWSHLKDECLWDPLSGLFVDQRWVDIGSALFQGTGWRHRGYNVSIANLHERPVVVDDEGYAIAGSDDRLRLFHFHAFDPRQPHELTTRSNLSTAHLRSDSAALDALCDEYAAIVLEAERTLPPAPPYVYAADSAGRPLSRHLRRAYRVQTEAGADLPSPFLPADRERWAGWRRGAWRTEARLLVSDTAKSARLVFPEEYGRVKDRFPSLARIGQSRLVQRSGLWK